MNMNTQSTYTSPKTELIQLQMEEFLASSGGTESYDLGSTEGWY